LVRAAFGAKAAVTDSRQSKHGGAGPDARAEPWRIATMPISSAARSPHHSWVLVRRRKPPTQSRRADHDASDGGRGYT
jgi:hypothetical protein